ncbi:unnamed protein product [Brachionus calyciflorus]|uniref:Tryptophan synthase beta chain-like PALP domain-containing protein n=1 Tax=Brachionus calyciflorus TaxID=104777 RepID=A0A813VUD9_9BILA|nr:unnamed protein product [Brachionus calyciflorus]
MKLINYKPPKWFFGHKLAQKFLHRQKVPTKFIKLLDQEDTQIQKLDYKIKNTKYEIYIKRDDQTHRDIHLQGNKLRKLEFLFAEALSQNAKHILTAGGLQSNHCRAVAAVSKLFNLDSHLFLRSNTNDPSKLNINGNLLINFLLDSKIYLIEKRAQYLSDIEYKMKILKDKIKQNLGEESYIIPIGGSNTIGLFGYIEQFNEMIDKQNIDEFISDIIVTSGSGGTMSGLAIANYMTGSKFKIHSFCVCDNSNYFYNHLEKEFQNLFGSDTGVDTRNFVNIIQCSRGLGYAKSTQDELNFLVDFFRQTNVLLDPVYTGKTMYSLVNLLNDEKPTSDYFNDPNAENFVSNLKGNRILFIHTGGQLGNFDVDKFSEFSLCKTKSNVFNCFGDNVFNIRP